MAFEISPSHQKGKGKYTSSVLQKLRCDKAAEIIFQLLTSGQQGDLQQDLRMATGRLIYHTFQLIYIYPLRALGNEIKANALGIPHELTKHASAMD